MILAPLCLSGCAKFAQGFAAGYNQSRQRHAQEDSQPTKSQHFQSDGLGGYYSDDMKTHCYDDTLGGFQCD